MNRRILLIEPNYKNKYPPLGLMKISTYHKRLSDEVTFYKGEYIDFVLETIYSKLLDKLTFIDSTVLWGEKKYIFLRFLKKGTKDDFQYLCKLSDDIFVSSNLEYYRNYFKNKKYLQDPEWDRIYITTLFTFHWKITIETINQFKQLCKDPTQVIVGGIAASLLPDEIKKETGIYPVVGLLNKPGQLDKDNDIIIDELPLDYSILYEIEYEYPENDGYYGYMTRGCVNKCAFCAVPTLEPTYRDYIGIKEQIENANRHFGEKRHLLLLDNNVLASKKFNQIIDEIKSCGFTKGATYLAPNEYDLAINGLRQGYNDAGYIKEIIRIYQKLIKKCPADHQREMYSKLSKHNLLSNNTAKKEEILGLDEYFRTLSPRLSSTRTKRLRYVDFNQGVDARLMTDENVKKLSEIPIRPLRIAFDSWSDRKYYENGVRLAAKNGIMHLSNYLLYNFTDKPLDLYYRLKLNVDLCEELGTQIYSFPMKYHPIKDPEYFKNRTYIGRYWNRKFIRSVQSVLNATKGKISSGREFFEEAFGHDAKEFEEIMYMPETLVIYRHYYRDNGVTDEWREAFNSLSPMKLSEAKKLIEQNNFNDISSITRDQELLDLLNYYTLEYNESK